MAEISVIERTGYYQDFHNEVACYTSKIVFCSDGIERNSFFERDFIIDIDGISVRATLSIELSGTTGRGSNPSAFFFLLHFKKCD